MSEANSLIKCQTAKLSDMLTIKKNTLRQQGRGGGADLKHYSQYMPQEIAA